MEYLQSGHGKDLSQRALELLERALSRQETEAADSDLEMRLAELREQAHEPQNGFTSTSS